MRAAMEAFQTAGYEAAKATSADGVTRYLCRSYAHPSEAPAVLTELPTAGKWTVSIIDADLAASMMAAYETAGDGPECVTAALSARLAVDRDRP